MARPKVPLISRRKALEAALRIMDTEGLDALSIRRLAVELGVNGASLYHHFENKEEIVVGAAEIALAEVRTPTETDENWRAWLPRNNRMLREAMLEHPELVPVIVRRSELGMGTQMLESTAERLIEEGVPVGAISPMLEALEMFAIGNAILETRTDGDGRRTRRPKNSILGKAERSRALTNDEIFEVVNAAIVDAIAAAAKQHEGKGGARKSTSRKPAAKRTPASRRNLTVVAGGAGRRQSTSSTSAKKATSARKRPAR